uniref:phage tail assembly chaperone n=1 Tax=Dialister succinatiphilus TaxID=487173 RepID=UPI0040385BFA
MFKGKTQIVEVNGKKYKLGKLDARSASYLALKVAAVIAPSVAGRGIDMEQAAKALPSMSREEFDEIQTMILKTVYEIKDAGGTEMSVPIINARGDFVDEDMAYDTSAVITLTVRAMIFNIGGFLQGDALKSVLKK